jgi:DNA-binding transcriptional LysR family regulator
LSSLLQACCRQFVMPRLELFRSAYPDIELILQVSIPLLNITAEKADLEVRCGTGGYTEREIFEDAGRRASWPMASSDQGRPRGAA